MGKKGDDDKKILTLIYKEIDREGSTQSGQTFSENFDQNSRSITANYSLIISVQLFKEHTESYKVITNLRRRIDKTLAYHRGLAERVPVVCVTRSVSQQNTQPRGEKNVLQ